MVDPIGMKPIATSDRKVVEVMRAAAPAPTPPAVAEPKVASQTVAVAKELAAAPPVDYERVARIRKAIAEGNFPIAPAQIADRLIAAKFDWARNDEA